MAITAPNVEARKVDVRARLAVLSHLAHGQAENLAPTARRRHVDREPNCLQLVVDLDTGSIDVGRQHCPTGFRPRRNITDIDQYGAGDGSSVLVCHLVPDHVPADEARVRSIGQFSGILVDHRVAVERSIERYDRVGERPTERGGLVRDIDHDRGVDFADDLVEGVHRSLITVDRVVCARIVDDFDIVVEPAGDDPWWRERKRPRGIVDRHDVRFARSQRNRFAAAGVADCARRSAIARINRVVEHERSPE